MNTVEVINTVLAILLTLILLGLAIWLEDY